MFSSFHPLNWRNIIIQSALSHPPSLVHFSFRRTWKSSRNMRPSIGVEGTFHGFLGTEVSHPIKGMGKAKMELNAAEHVGFFRLQAKKHFDIWLMPFLMHLLPPPQKKTFIWLGFRFIPTCGWRSQASEISSLCAWESTLEVEVPVEVVQPMAAWSGWGLEPTRAALKRWMVF